MLGMQRSGQGLTLVDSNGRLQNIKLRRLRRGSVMRAGASVVASGPATTVTSIAAGATEVIDIDIIEDCHIGFLILSATTLVGLSVVDVSIDNNGVTNANIPGEMFRADSVFNPVFGHFVTKNSTVRVTITNTTAAAVDTQVGFTALEGDSR